MEGMTARPRNRQVCLWLTVWVRLGRFASGRANFLVQSVFAGFVASPAGRAFRIWALVRIWAFAVVSVKVRIDLPILFAAVRICGLCDHCTDGLARGVHSGRRGTLAGFGYAVRVASHAGAYV